MARYTRNQKTLDWCREQGWYPWKVEIFNGFSGFKTDLYYIIDYLAITEDRTIGVQSTGSDFADHIRKLFIQERQNTIDWLYTPNRELVLIGWRKVKKKRGGKLMVWKPRIMWITYKNNKLQGVEL